MAYQTTASLADLRDDKQTCTAAAISCGSGIPGRCDTEDVLSAGAADYHMNKAAVVRPGQACVGVKNGLACSYIGIPSTSVFQETFIQGRTVPTSACAKVPSEDPPSFGANPAPSMNPDYSMMPIQTRVPGNCDSLSETDTTVYAMFPMAFQRGFMGVSAVPGTDLQSRRLNADLFDGMRETADGTLKSTMPQKKPCDSYGDYGMNNPYVKYG